MSVPLDKFPKLAAMLARLGDEPEAWPWLLEDDRDDQIAIAAGELAMSSSAVTNDPHLLKALRIR